MALWSHVEVQGGRGALPHLPTASDDPAYWEGRQQEALASGDIATEAVLPGATVSGYYVQVVSSELAGEMRSVQLCSGWLHTAAPPDVLSWRMAFVCLLVHAVFLSTGTVFPLQEEMLCNGYISDIFMGPHKLFIFRFIFLFSSKQTLIIWGCVTTDSGILWGPQCHMQVIRTLSLFIWSEIDSSIPFSSAGQVRCRDF